MEFPSCLTHEKTEARVGKVTLLTTAEQVGDFNLTISPRSMPRLSLSGWRDSLLAVLLQDKQGQCLGFTGNRQVAWLEPELQRGSQYGPTDSVFGPSHGLTQTVLAGSSIGSELALNRDW